MPPELAWIDHPLMMNGVAFVPEPPVTPFAAVKLPSPSINIGECALAVGRGRPRVPATMGAKTRRTAIATGGPHKRTVRSPKEENEGGYIKMASPTGTRSDFRARPRPQ